MIIDSRPRQRIVTRTIFPAYGGGAGAGVYANDRINSMLSSRIWEDGAGKSNNNGEEKITARLPIAVGILILHRVATKPAEEEKKTKRNIRVFIVEYERMDEYYEVLLSMYCALNFTEC